MDNIFGNKTWNNFSPVNILDNSKKNRIIGLTFPAQQQTLGLEPSVLSVMPDDSECEYSLSNILFNDNDVCYYLCSVYISGMKEFKEWALHHNKSKIIVGGYHPTTFPEEFIPYADKIIKGPCDDFWATINQVGQIVDGITSHKNIPRYDLYSISYNQQIIPDKLPYEISTSINTSMGCPMRCDFCCSPIMCNKIISKPIDLIEREVFEIGNHMMRDSDYFNNSKNKYIFIRDENFPLQKDWKKRLSLISSLGCRIYLFASANLLTEDMVRTFKDYGVYMVCLGLENINSHYAKNNKLDEVCALLKKYDIMVYLSFIVDPLEIVGAEKGKVFYNRLMGRFYDLKPEMVCGNFLMPFRGTALWEKYYHLISEEDYTQYDSKSAFLIKNEILRKKMEFYMFYYQYIYYTSDFYNNEIREFDCGDTLSLRFEELKRQFVPVYERIWDVRP